MSSRMFIGAAMAVISLVLATGCTHEGKKKPQNDSSRVLANLGANSFTTIEFQKGKSELTDQAKESLKEFASKVNKANFSIEEIKILAWSDKEYPKADKKTNPRDAILASDRASSIKDLLRDEIKNEKEIHLFNMAKRPGAFNEMLNTKDYALKTALEKSGPSTTKNSDGELSYTKASKAIVIIDYDHQ